MLGNDLVAPGSVNLD